MLCCVGKKIYHIIYCGTHPYCHNTCVHTTAARFYPHEHVVVLGFVTETTKSHSLKKFIAIYILFTVAWNLIVTLLTGEYYVLQKEL